MALLLRRRGRPRRLVHRPRRALEAAACSSVRASCVFAAGTGVAVARVAVGLLGVLLFAVVEVAALAGTRSAFRNFAPTFVYVDFWVGLPLLSALVGDVWRWLSPWRAVADAVAWTSRRAGFAEGAAFTYPVAARAVAGGVPARAVRDARARVLGSLRAPHARSGDRVLQRPHVARDARVRPRRVDAERRGASPSTSA